MSEASVGIARPYRRTKGEWSKETTRGAKIRQEIWRGITWSFRRLRPMLYRPVALFGTTGFVWTYFWVTPWIPAIVGMLVSLVWPLVHPDSYLKHMAWRGPSFLQGLKIRYRPRRKFMGAKVLNKEEPLPPTRHVHKEGDTTVVEFTIPFGDEVEFWQQQSGALASAFGKIEAVVDPVRKHTVTDLRPLGDFRLKLHPVRGLRPFTVELACKPDLLKRPPFVQIRHTETKRLKPRRVRVEFLDREPFLKPVDIDFLDLHRPLDITEGAGPTGKDRRGLPYFENDRMSTLWVALSGGGKSNAERCLVYSDWERVQAKLVENWGADYAYGVELDWMRSQFARVEYGEDPQSVNEFWHDLRVLMQDRLKGMRGQTVFFTPVTGDPLIKAYEDEALLLNLPEFAEVRAEVHKNKVAVLTNGRKAGIQVRSFTQSSMKEEYPARDKYKITKTGILQRRRHVDIVMGEGAWQSGIRAHLLDPEAPGIFYEATEGALAPIQMRYGDVPPESVLKLPWRPDSFTGLKQLESKPAHEPSFAERVGSGQYVRAETLEETEQRLQSHGSRN